MMDSFAYYNPCYQNYGKDFHPRDDQPIF